MSIWHTEDEIHVRAAKGSLGLAAGIAKQIEENGPCPLSATQIKEAVDLAKGAVVLLQAINIKLDET